MNITSALDCLNGILMAADVRNGIRLLHILFPVGASFSSFALWHPPGVYFRAHFLLHVSFWRNICS